MRLGRTGFCLDGDWQWLVTVNPSVRPFVSLAGNGSTESQTSCQSSPGHPPARGIPTARIHCASTPAGAHPPPIGKSIARLRDCALNVEVNHAAGIANRLRSSPSGRRSRRGQPGFKRFRRRIGARGCTSVTRVRSVHRRGMQRPGVPSLTRASNVARCCRCRVFPGWPALQHLTTPCSAGGNGVRGSIRPA
jgi:hypothetical protein